MAAAEAAKAVRKAMKSAGVDDAVFRKALDLLIWRLTGTDQENIL